MKKIRLWKIIALLLVTLGIYGIIWLALRRNEANHAHKLKLPHWHWLISPSVIGLILTLIVGIPAFLLTPPLVFTAIVFFTVSLTFFVAWVISIWWMVRFGQGIGKITHGRITTGWTVAYWIITAFGIVVAAQYYFNRPIKKAATKKPSRKFIITSLMVFIICTVVNVVSTAFYFMDGGEWDTFQQESQEIDRLYNESDRLYKKYEDCISRLDAKFPGELMIEDEADYNKGYELCEQIRLKQNSAAEQYDKAVAEW